MTRETSITVDIHNNPELLKLIHDTMPYMNGWWYHPSAGLNNQHWKEYPNKTARYFRFKLDNKRFIWSHYDNTPPTGKIYSITSIPTMSSMLEVIYQMGENK